MTCRRIETAYTTPSATTALGGVKRLLAAKLAPDERVREWLRGQEAYTLHKAAPKRFARRPTVVAGPHEQIQADLMDVRSHKDANDGTTFLLTTVDVFSKVGWAIPLRTKTGREVSNALRGLFAGYGFERFRPIKARNFSTRTSKRFCATPTSKVLFRRTTSSRRPSSSVSTKLCARKYTDTSRKRAGLVSSTSCRTLSTRTTG